MPNKPAKRTAPVKAEPAASTRAPRTPTTSAPPKKSSLKTSPALKTPAESAKRTKNPAGKAVGEGLAAGDKAPSFRLADDAGDTVSLSDFAGKPLVLYFYPKDATPGCTQESCDFRDNMGRLAAAGAAVAGVSADSVESHKKFKAKQALNFPLLSDPEHEALEAYGVWREKSLYGRKFMGIVRSTFVIDGKGVIAAVWPKVSVSGHVDEVLAAVKALKGAKA